MMYLTGFRTSCTFDYITQDLGTRTQLMFMYLMGFVGPLLISIFCYWNVFSIVRQAGRKQSKSGPATESRQVGAASAINKKI